MESWVVEKILTSLTDDFGNIVWTIKETKDLSMLSVEELVWGTRAAKKEKKYYNDGKAGHLVKYYQSKRKKETNFLIEEVEEEEGWGCRGD